MIRQIRESMQNIVIRHSRMSGDDSVAMAAGLAAARALPEQKRVMTEIAKVNIDKAYGHTLTVLGTVASVITVVRILSTRSNADAMRDVLLDVLEGAERSLSQWRVVYSVDESNFDGSKDFLDAERRAIFRARLALTSRTKGSRGAITEPHAALMDDLELATLAAFPPCSVDRNTQKNVCSSIHDGSLFRTLPSELPSEHPSNQPASSPFVPLAELPPFVLPREERNCVTATGDSVTGSAMFFGSTTSMSTLNSPGPSVSDRYQDPFGHA